MQIARLAAMSVAVAALSACQLGVQPDVYLSDVEAVRADGKPIPATAVVSFQVPGEEKCAEASGMLAKPLAEAFAAAEYKGCRKVEFSTLADFTVTTELVMELKNQKSDSAFPVYLGIYDEEDGTHSISVYQNSDAMKSLIARIEETRDIPTGRVEYQVAARVINDTAGPVTISVGNVYVDGTPKPYAEELELARRAEAIIAVSDVSNDGFAKGIWAMIARIK